MRIHTCTVHITYYTRTYRHTCRVTCKHSLSLEGMHSIGFFWSIFIYIFFISGYSNNQKFIGNKNLSSMSLSIYIYNREYDCWGKRLVCGGSIKWQKKMYPIYMVHLYNLIGEVDGNTLNNWKLWCLFMFLLYFTNNNRIIFSFEYYISDQIS